VSGVRVGINGFGRIGRLALRAAWGWPELTFAHVNELTGGAETSAHLLALDSVHGRWPHDVGADGDTIVVDGVRVGHSSVTEPGAAPWVELARRVALTLPQE
jgi:glyceraldehyde 3-phosphate dehydrogenase